MALTIGKCVVTVLATGVQYFGTLSSASDADEAMMQIHADSVTLGDTSDPSDGAFIAFPISAIAVSPHQTCPADIPASRQYA
jgi:hypothetical protein